MKPGFYEIIESFSSCDKYDNYTNVDEGEIVSVLETNCEQYECYGFNWFEQSDPRSNDDYFGCTIYINDIQIHNVPITALKYFDKF